MKKLDKRYCDRCGVLLTHENNTCGYELCDECNDKLEEEVKHDNDKQLLSF